MAKWSGYKCKARRVIIEVGEARLPTFWYAPFVGQEMRAVEITTTHPFPEETFYIADEDGNGWHKVTVEGGGPHWGHLSVNAARVIRERTAADLDDKDCRCRD